MKSIVVRKNTPAEMDLRNVVSIKSCQKGNARSRSRICAHQKGKLNVCIKLAFAVLPHQHSHPSQNSGAFPVGNHASPHFVIAKSIVSQ